MAPRKPVSPVNPLIGPSHRAILLRADDQTLWLMRDDWTEPRAIDANTTAALNRVIGATQPKKLPRVPMTPLVLNILNNSTYGPLVEPNGVIHG